MKLSHRIYLYVAVFALLAGVMGYASTVPMSQSEATSLYQQIQGISPTTLVIYENNVQVALKEFIPGFGPAYGLLSAYETGLVVSASGQIPSATTTGFENFFFLLVTPIFWMEFSCYSLAIEESISIIVAFVNRDFLKVEWKWLLGSILFVVSALLVSAKLEASLVGILG